MRVTDPTANCAGSPSLKIRSGPGNTAGLGRRITPASAVPIASTTLHKAASPRKSRRFDPSGIDPLLAELKTFHGNGMSRAPFGAQGAADAAILVLEDGGVGRIDAARAE